MSTTKMETTPTERLNTADRLDEILSNVEQELRQDIFTQFWLRDPLSFTRVLISTDLDDSVKAALLACKSSAKEKYQGESLEILIERASRLQWQRLEG
jgi:hypothetical protein